MKTTLVLAMTMGTVLTAQTSYTPARYASGGRPNLPALAVGGGQAFVELSLDSSGSVSKVTVLRSTPPFTEALVQVAGAWKFKPAMTETPDGPRPTTSKVVVAAQFRSPAMLGPTQGEAPKTLASASAEASAPSGLRDPVYPPMAQNGGVVLIEVKVDASGVASEAVVLGSAPPFDQPALDVARKTSFRPARINGKPAPSYAYLIFGFPAPITR